MAKKQPKKEQTPQETPIPPEASEKDSCTCESWKTLLVIGVVAFVIGAGGMWFYQNFDVTAKTADNQEELVTDEAPKMDKDDKESDETSAEDATDSADADLPVESELPAYEIVKSLLAEKHLRSTSEMMFEVSSQTDDHMQGSLRFEGDISGGMFLAGRNDMGEWKIVYDGHGTIPCEDITPYNFPTSMVPECIDNGGNLIYR